MTDGADPGPLGPRSHGPGDRGTFGPGDPGEPEVLVLADPDATGAAAAGLIVDALRTAVDRRGRADVATTGGSTPGAIYRALVADPLRERVPWAVLHLWFGDDRYVPRHHTDSNLIPVDAILLGQDGGPGSPLPHANVHPWPVAETARAGGDASDCAEAYAAEMRGTIPADAAGRPVFDVVLVGIGPDGHLLSVFPGSRAFDAPGWTIAVPAPTHIAPHVERLTCTPPLLDATPVLISVAFGGSKAAVIARILDGPRDERVLPAQRARRAGATWVLDAAAAAHLDPVRWPVVARAAARPGHG